jgi:hypothetical protein
MTVTEAAIALFIAPPSGENASSLVCQFLLPQHDARQVGMQWVDFTHCPAIEGLRDHDVDEVQNLHATNVAHG